MVAIPVKPGRNSRRRVIAGSTDAERCGFPISRWRIEHDERHAVPLVGCEPHHHHDEALGVLVANHSVRTEMWLAPLVAPRRTDVVLEALAWFRFSRRL